jgi:hypothetical protein
MAHPPRLAMSRVDGDIPKGFPSSRPRLRPTRYLGVPIRTNPSILKELDQARVEHSEKSLKRRETDATLTGLFKWGEQEPSVVAEATTLGWLILSRWDKFQRAARSKLIHHPRGSVLLMDKPADGKSFVTEKNQKEGKIMYSYIEFGTPLAGRILYGHGLRAPSVSPPEERPRDRVARYYNERRVLIRRARAN